MPPKKIIPKEIHALSKDIHNKQKRALTSMQREQFKWPCYSSLSCGNFSQTSGSLLLEVVGQISFENLESRFTD